MLKIKGRKRKNLIQKYQQPHLIKMILPQHSLESVKSVEKAKQDHTEQWTGAI